MKLSVELAEASHKPASLPVLNRKFITTAFNCQLNIHRGQPAPSQSGSRRNKPGSVRSIRRMVSAKTIYSALTRKMVR